MMQVPMIKNTICARSFSVHRLILTFRLVLSSWSFSKKKIKKKNLQSWGRNVYLKKEKVG